MSIGPHNHRGDGCNKREAFDVLVENHVKGEVSREEDNGYVIESLEGALSLFPNKKHCDMEALQRLSIVRSLPS
jgi:hypothetical protein